MRTTIDAAGRVVVPKPLRDQVGLRPGPVELFVDGSGLRIEPVLTAELTESDGRLVVSASGVPVDDDMVRTLRQSDQR